MCRVIVPIVRIPRWNQFRKKDILGPRFKAFNTSCSILYRLTEMSSNKEEGHACNIFQGKRDVYKGIIVRSNEIVNCGCFSSVLEESLKYWKSTDIRTVWFNVTLENSEYVPVLTKNGFKFHHTKGDEVIMYKWLPENEKCNIPVYSHTMIGVGAVVINPSGELLVIQERFSRRLQWKLPGGYVEPGENLGDAAVREVQEETNVQTEFQFITCFRHLHNVNFGCSDIYFIACLKPLSDIIQRDGQEIKDCMWMKVEEFLEHPLVHEGNKFFVKKCLECKQQGNGIGCIQSMHPAYDRPQCVYSNMDSKDISPYILNYGK